MTQLIVSLYKTHEVRFLEVVRHHTQTRSGCGAQGKSPMRALPPCSDPTCPGPKEAVAGSGVGEGERER